MIELLYGDTWVSMSLYFRILLISSLTYPLNVLNLNILQVYGRSDLFLKIDLINILIGVFLIVIVFIFGLGINGLLISILLSSLISIFINSYYSKFFINYSILKQFKDIFLILVISIFMGLIVYLSFTNLPYNLFLNLVLSVIIGIITYISLSYIFKLNELFFYINTVVRFVHKLILKT
jgi:O-antigen/teichoic acid export membrane protein